MYVDKGYMVSKMRPSQRLVPEHQCKNDTYTRVIAQIGDSQDVLTCGEIPASCKGLFCTNPAHDAPCVNWYLATRLRDKSWEPQR